MSTYLEFDYITKNTFSSRSCDNDNHSSRGDVKHSSEVAVVLMIIIAAVAIININSEVATTINIDLQPQLNTGI